MRRLLVIVLLLLAGASVAALPELSPEELENRRRLEQWRKHPEQLARLRYYAQVFLALPAARRQQLIQLDHDLHEETSSVQARLANVADRYARWLAQLKKDPQRRADYQSIIDAPDKAARLDVIRELRAADWLRDQPKGVQDEIAKLQVKRRAERIKEVKDDDRQRAREWLIASRFWNELAGKRELPSRLQDFPMEVQTYVQEYLKPMLSREERARLEKAQGQWPLYPMTLVELADKHPPALPGADGPRRFDELPREVYQKLQIKKPANPKLFKGTEGKWPSFAIAVSGIAARRGIDFPHELWPYQLGGLSEPMQTFVLKTLMPALEGDDRQFNPPKSWPHYPLFIQELAKKYHLSPPWFTLPGPPSRWEPYRFAKPQIVQGLPELPQQKLRDFLQFGLSDQERDALKLPADDPAGWQRLHRIYFEKNPQELKNLRQRDQRKQRPNPFLNLPKEKMEKWEL